MEAAAFDELTESVCQAGEIRRGERCETCQFLPCRCEDLRGGRTGCAQSSAGWPTTSDGLGVHPSQRQDAYDESVRLGVPTYYDGAGRPVLTDPGHRKKLLKALGYEDKGKKVITMPRR
jgi:hypothetical protein